MVKHHRRNGIARKRQYLYRVPMIHGFVVMVPDVLCLTGL
jgi:hypothetical protein